MRRPRWTLRTWLIVPTAAIVTILSGAGALLQTDTLVRAWLGSTRQLSELAARQVAEYIMLRLEDIDTESSRRVSDVYRSGSSSSRISITTRNWAACWNQARRALIRSQRYRLRMRTGL